jgi:hypothetical protein
VTAGGACDGCGISFDRAAAAFQFQTLDGPILKCVRCAVRHRPMLKRSTAVALVVGTVLMIINQGDVLLGAKWPGALIWKIPLTYLVPFVVATWGALVNGRVRG